MIAAMVAWCMAGGMLSAGDWPAFRGPQGNGVAREDRAPLHWGPDQNVRWKTALPGPGNGSPIVASGRVFLTCADSEGKERSLYCFDRKTGKQLWVRTVEFPEVELTHKTNPYCASTPASDGARVVVWHGSAGLYCYDLDGTELWSKDLGDVRHMWGFGSSPIIHRGKVILNHGPGVETFMAALDLKTGDLLWKTEEPGGANDGEKRMVGSWSTPVVATVDGKEQILCSMATRVVAYDPQNGEILWTVGGLPSERGDLVYTSPMLAGDFGVAMGGYKGPAIGFKLGGSGDVTDSNRAWREEDRQPQRIGSGVVIGDYLYLANAGPSTAQCIEIKTGKELWVDRLNGGDHWGSVVLAAGRLYVTNQKGTTHVLKPNPEKLELLASNSLDEGCNTTPAVSDGEIFLRTDEHLYCIAEE